MSSWSNRTVLAGSSTARNGTTSHTCAFAQPAAGALLLATVAGAVTSTTPAGWSLVKSAVNNSGLYLFSKVATGSETSFSTTHNASNYPISGEVFEFPAGSTVQASIIAVNQNDTTGTATLSGLTGTYTRMAANSQANSSTSGVTSVAWAAPSVEDDDESTIKVATDGVAYSLAYDDASSGASFAVSRAVTGGSANGNEIIAWAVNVAAVSGGTTPVTASRSTTWRALASSTSTRGTAWAVRTVATATRSATWSVLTPVTSARGTAWAVTARVAQSRAASWATLSATSSTRGTSWAADVQVTAQRGTIWGVAGTLATITATRSASWSTGATVTNTRHAEWAVTSAVSAARIASWSVNARVTAQRGTGWAVAGALVDVTAERGTAWATLTSTTAQCGTAWATLTVTEQARVASWDVAGYVTATRRTIWRVDSDLIARDVIFAGHIEPDRWFGSIDPDRWSAALDPDRWSGELVQQ